MCNLSIKISFVGLKLLRHTSLHFAEYTALLLSVLLVVRALSVLKLQKGNQMPEDYPRSFREAAAVFQHAQVYDSDKKIVKHMRPIRPYHKSLWSPLMENLISLDRIFLLFISCCCQVKFILTYKVCLFHIKFIFLDLHQ